MSKQTPLEAFFQAIENLKTAIASVDTRPALEAVKQSAENANRQIEAAFNGFEVQPIPSSEEEAAELEALAAFENPSREDEETEAYARGAAIAMGPVDPHVTIGSMDDYKTRFGAHEPAPETEAMARRGHGLRLMRDRVVGFLRAKALESSMHDERQGLRDAAKEIEGWPVTPPEDPNAWEEVFREQRDEAQEKIATMLEERATLRQQATDAKADRDWMERSIEKERAELQATIATLTKERDTELADGTAVIQKLNDELEAAAKEFRDRDEAYRKRDEAIAERDNWEQTSARANEASSAKSLEIATLRRDLVEVRKQVVDLQTTERQRAMHANVRKDDIFKQLATIENLIIHVKAQTKGL